MIDRRTLLGGSLAAGALAALPRAQAGARIPQVAPGLNAAGVKLYQRLASAPDNVLLSPVSVGLAFAMLSLGAGGNTRLELATLFRFPGGDGFAELCANLTKQLTGAKGATVAIANRLWGAASLSPSKAYLEATARHFGAGLERVDFAQKVAAAKRINGWVAKQTADKITDLVPAELLGPLTRLVLTNAVYFKGAWETPFDPKLTWGAPFTRLDGQKVEAKLMQAERPASVAREGNLAILRLAYRGGFAMYLALPDAVDGLRALEPTLDHERLEWWAQAAIRAPERHMYVAVPRFRARFRASLVDHLKALGVRDVFAPGFADLRAIGEGILLTDALHQGFIDVNEEGTEAAAATALVVSVDSDTPSFRADHPFFYWIRHEATGAVLFAGRLVDPTIPA